MRGMDGIDRLTRSSPWLSALGGLQQIHINAFQRAHFSTWRALWVWETLYGLVMFGQTIDSLEQCR